jgi:hypothetical protein
MKNENYFIFFLLFSSIRDNMRRRHQLSNMNDMFLSVANGNLEGLENYLKNGGNVNLKDGNGTTLLHKV